MYPSHFLFQSQAGSHHNHDDIEFGTLVLENQWDQVIKHYEEDTCFHNIKLKGRGTALHVAINTGNKDVVEKLIDEIVKHKNESCLTLFDDARGATPLHLAAYRGFTSICECIIGKDGRRQDLIQVKNENGETPLFWAVLARKRQAFVYLHQFIPHDINFVMDNNCTTILHVAIRREMFDLANIIVDCYPGLKFMKNKDDVSPLEVLATKTSAFRSGSHLSWWKKIFFFCTHVEFQDAKTRMKSYEKGVKKDKDAQSENSIPLYSVDELKKTRKIRHALSQLNFISCANILCKHIQKFVSRLPFLSLLDLEAIKTMKEKHTCGGQLLDEFMEDPCESYMGPEDVVVINPSGGDEMPMKADEEDEDDVNFAKYYEREKNKKLGDSHNTSKQEKEENTKKSEGSKKVEEEDKTFLAVAKSGIAEIMGELNSKVPPNVTSDKKGLLLVAMKDIKTELSTEKNDKNERAYLIAAKHGIIEMVSLLQDKIKSVVYETNSNNENVLLLAVKYRQPRVVEKLEELLGLEMFHSLNLEVDNNGNTMLHLAAYASIHSKNITWKISGEAMNMMWDIKWYKYIKGIVPEHFSHRTNNEGKTPSEIFKEEHQELLQRSIEWLKDTAESCSVVAALIAGLSFATSGSVPGGNDSETGKPALEGQPAFEGFAISSLIGLYFSGTALIMFLSILTSRKQIEYFNRILPMKLLLGLSCLFVSIVAMFISFCAGHFFVLTDKYCKRDILFYLYIAVSLPVIFYAGVQFPLYFDLFKVIWKKVPPPSVKGVHL